MKKKDFLFKDRIIKGITTDGHFKIAVIKTTDVIKSARKRHNLSLLNTVLLGRALTGVMLLASNLKAEERVQLRIEGSGPIGMMVAEATSHGEIRGYVSNSEAELDYAQASELGEGFGAGILTFSKVLYNEAQPISGTVELVKGNITEDLAYYLHQSEQISSAISLDVGIDKGGNVSQAGGILIQALPEAPEEMKSKLQENVRTMPVLHSLLQKDIYIDDLLYRISKPFEVKELERFPVHFFCRCNKERFKNALAMVDLEELKNMDDKSQELVCHYCNEQYIITKEEIQRIIQDARVRLN
ncbi:MAG: Hsp33 family molecular chaperone HslO [Balneolales bacterium]